MSNMAVQSVLSRNNVKIVGDPSGRPIMFANGPVSPRAMWRRLSPEFGDHSVVSCDLIGTGHSDLDAYDPVRYDSLHGHADDVLVIIDELDLNDVVYVGHSVSAIVGLLAASREPAAFGRLVLVSASPRYLDDVGYPSGGAHRDVEQLLARNGSEFTRQAESDHDADTRHEIERHFARVALLADHRRDLAGVLTPTLLVHAAEDPLIPPAVARYMHDAMPKSTLVIVPPSDGNPVESGMLARLVRGFLR